MFLDETFQKLKREEKIKTKNNICFYYFYIGESGSGKTEASKCVLRYIAEASKHIASVEATKENCSNQIQCWKLLEMLKRIEMIIQADLENIWMLNLTLE